MYKIYINETPLILISSKDLEKSIYPRKSVLLLPYSGRKKHLLNYMDNLEKKHDYEAIVIHHQDVDLLFSDFLSLVKISRAAGGLVTNKKDEILFIFRRGFWDLPKGKLDDNESYKTASVREVKEECGLKNVQRGEKLITTYHVFKNKSRQRILKKTKWYKMTSTDQALIAQKEEDIEIAKWRSLGEFLASKDKAYNNIYDVLFTYFQKT